MLFSRLLILLLFNQLHMKSQSSNTLEVSSITGDVIIATMSDKNYISYLKSWHDRIRTFGHKSTIVIESMDVEVDTTCSTFGLICTKYNTKITADIRIMEKKPHFQFKLLQTGYDLLFCDIDIFWNHDILAEIRAHPNFNKTDILITGHGYNEYCNVGLFYAKSNSRTKSFFYQLYQNMINKNRKKEAFEQNIFNAMLNIGDIRYKRFPPIIDKLNLTYEILDRSRFTEWDGHKWGFNKPEGSFSSLHLTSMSLKDKKTCLSTYYDEALAQGKLLQKNRACITRKRESTNVTVIG